jgi:hypothetical protein
VHIGFADPYRHRQYGSGNGVLGGWHVATVMRAEPGQVDIVEGNR